MDRMPGRDGHMAAASFGEGNAMSMEMSIEAMADRPGISRRRFAAGLFSGGASLLLGACTYAPTYDSGPPPHAPAHGYRYRHPDGVVLVYDSSIAMYLVLGQPYHYYSGGHFYWYDRDVWQVGDRSRGPWRRAPDRGGPPGQAKKGRGGPPGPKKWPK